MTPSVVDGHSKRRPRIARAPLSSDCARVPEDIIRGVLRLRCCVDQELAIVAKLFEPAGHVRGLILDDCGCNADFRAKVGGSHFRAQFFF